MEESHRQGTGRFVYASSYAVYGEQEKLPIREDAPLRPINTYGASKLAGEALINAYREEITNYCSKVFQRIWTKYAWRPLCRRDIQVPEISP